MKCLILFSGKNRENIISLSSFEFAHSTVSDIICFRLPIGYIFRADGHMDPVSWCDFEFYNLGDDGIPPKEFTMNFIAGKSL